MGLTWNFQMDNLRKKKKKRFGDVTVREFWFLGLHILFSFD